MKSRPASAVPGSPKAIELTGAVELEHELRVVVRGDRVRAGGVSTNSTTSFRILGQAAAQSGAVRGEGQAADPQVAEVAEGLGGGVEDLDAAARRDVDQAGARLDGQALRQAVAELAEDGARVRGRARAAVRRRSSPRGCPRRRGPCRKSGRARWPAACVAWPPAAVKANSSLRSGPPLTSDVPSGGRGWPSARCWRRSARSRWRSLPGERLEHGLELRGWLAAPGGNRLLGLMNSGLVEGCVLGCAGVPRSIDVPGTVGRAPRLTCESSLGTAGPPGAVAPGCRRCRSPGRGTGRCGRPGRCRPEVAVVWSSQICKSPPSSDNVDGHALDAGAAVVVGRRPLHLVVRAAGGRSASRSASWWEPPSRPCW